jgi:hypothetical protein
VPFSKTSQNRFFFLELCNSFLFVPETSLAHGK